MSPAPEKETHKKSGFEPDWPPIIQVTFLVGAFLILWLALRNHVSTNAIWALLIPLIAISTLLRAVVTRKMDGKPVVKFTVLWVGAWIGLVLIWVFAAVPLLSPDKNVYTAINETKTESNQAASVGQCKKAAGKFYDAALQLDAKITAGLSNEEFHNLYSNVVLEENRLDGNYDQACFEELLSPLGDARVSYGEGLADWDQCIEDDPTGCDPDTAGAKQIEAATEKLTQALQWWTSN